MTLTMQLDVADLTNRFVRALKRGDEPYARECATRILGIYRAAGVDDPKLDYYRKFVDPLLP